MLEVVPCPIKSAISDHESGNDDNEPSYCPLLSLDTFSEVGSVEIILEERDS